MKKIITLILAFSMLLALTATFCSCSEEEEAATFCSCSEEEEAPADQRVKLTATNFEEYFAVNITYNYQMVHLYRDSSGDDYYDIFCTVTITTAPKGNYTYENVTILYNTSDIVLTPYWEVLSSVGAQIDVHGYSQATLLAIQKDVPDHNISLSMFERSSTNHMYLKFKSASGTVIIPAE